MTRLLLVIVLVLAAIAGGMFVSRKWDGKTRFTIIDVKEGVNIESWDLQNKTGFKIKIPDNLEIQTSDGSKWLAVKIGRVSSPQWAAWEVSKSLGIPYTSEKSKLGLWDRLQWWLGTRSIDWQVIDMTEKGWTVETRAPDGLEIRKLSPKWETVTRDLFSSAVLINEGIGLTIINFSGIDGYGNLLARIVENAGIKVNMIKTGDGNLKGCLIKGNKEALKSLSAKNLLRIFTCRSQVEDLGRDLELDLGS